MKGSEGAKRTDIPTPVDQRQNPIGSSFVIVSPFSPFCVKRILSGRTSLTREFVRTSTWSWANLCSANFESASSYVFRIWPLLCMTCTEISLRRIFGKDRPKSSLSRSNNSAANSTPVGPPPETTKDRRRLRSSSLVVGRQACSRFCKTLFLICRASSISLRK